MSDILDSIFRTEEKSGDERINGLRNLAIAVFYLNQLFNYHVLGVLDSQFHYSSSALIAVYAVFAWGYWLAVNRRGRYRRGMKYWAMAADSAFVAGVLYLGNGPSSPLVPLFYLLIAVSALRLHRGAVYACAGFSAAAFLLLQAHAAAARPGFALPGHEAFMQVLCMLLAGLAGGHLVASLRGLAGRVSEARAKQARTEEALFRFVSPQVGAQIMSSGGTAGLAGRRVEAAILMCDIRGFTPMSEKMDPADLMALLNSYFKGMVEVVFRHGGTLDKFIGDAMLVVFGAPLPQPDMDARAVRCAADMQKSLAEFNASQRAAGAPELAAGVSVHRGTVVAGTLGSEMRLEYTVLGDVVNLTQRMQSKAGPGMVIVSQAVYERTGGAFRYRRMEPFAVKGREEPVLAHELLY